MDDKLGLVIELRALIFTAFVLAIVKFVRGATNESESKKWTSGLETLLYLIIESYPLYLTYKYSSRRSQDCGGQMTPESEMLDYISFPEKRQSFLKHLEREFSVENLSFYEACVALEVMVGSKKPVDSIVDRLRYIRGTFVETSSISSVNISYENRCNLLSVLAEEKLQALVSIDDTHLSSVVEALGESKDEILQLMARDSFRRFKEAVKENRHRKGLKGSLAKLFPSAGSMSTSLNSHDDD
eukprot:TRINITY_DN8938_c0_g1_i1.p1 TRINITY_DN8938_c0_g1~~TRINITY_DN8938_c0_g1_i1.p1  ORF type:complete len:242 (+),score=59.02 TRINITY_DN8938_c0_g1_i1:57-782(+)